MRPQHKLEAVWYLFYGIEAALLYLFPAWWPITVLVSIVPARFLVSWSFRQLKLCLPAIVASMSEAMGTSQTPPSLPPPTMPQTIK